MPNPLSNALDACTVGQPQVVGSLVMTPLYGAVRDASYLILDDALKQGQVEVTEVSEGGSVPELRLVNRSDRDVLLLDGEELIGARQNRVLNLTILVGPFTTTVVPVSCVERGRWSYRTRHFASGGRALHARGRAAKAAQVSQSLAARQQAASDQGALWQEIARKSVALSTDSATEALADVYTANAPTLDEFRRKLHWTPGQCGAVVSVGRSFAGIELFDAESTCRKVLPKLIDSYALDALEVGAEGDAAAANFDVKKLLAKLRTAPVDIYKAVGKGDDVRIRTKLIQGAALVNDGHLIHLSAFKAA